MEIDTRSFTILARLTNPARGVLTVALRAAAVAVLVAGASYIPILVTGPASFEAYRLLNLGLFGIFWVLLCTSFLTRHARIIRGLLMTGGAGASVEFSAAYTRFVRFLNSPSLVIYALLCWLVMFGYVLIDFLNIVPEIRGWSIFSSRNRSDAYVLSIAIMLVPASIVIAGGAHFLRGWVRLAQDLKTMRAGHALPALRYWLGEADKETLYSVTLFATGLIVIYLGLDLPPTSLIFAAALFTVTLICLYAYLTAALAYRTALRRNVEARLREVTEQKSEDLQEMVLRNTGFSGAGRVLAGIVISSAPLVSFALGDQIRSALKTALEYYGVG